jgi:hypothetical protein
MIGKCHRVTAHRRADGPRRAVRHTHIHGGTLLVAARDPRALGCAARSRIADRRAHSPLALPKAPPISRRRGLRSEAYPPASTDSTNRKERDNGRQRTERRTLPKRQKIEASPPGLSGRHRSPAENIGSRAGSRTARTERNFSAWPRRQPRRRTARRAQAGAGR